MLTSLLYRYKVKYNFLMPNALHFGVSSLKMFSCFLTYYFSSVYFFLHSTAAGIQYASISEVNYFIFSLVFPQAGCLHNKELAAIVTKVMAFLHNFCAESPDQAFSVLHKRASLFQ